MQVEESRLEVDIAPHEAHDSGLCKVMEEKPERLQRLDTELIITGFQKKKDAKDEQLKGIQQMAAKVIEMLSKMCFDEIEAPLRKIYQMSMPGYLPQLVEETAEQQLPAAPPKLSTTTYPCGKTAIEGEMPETYQQRSAGRLITASPTQPIATSIVKKEMMASSYSLRPVIFHSVTCVCMFAA